MWKRKVKEEDLKCLWGARDLLKFLWKSDYAPIYIMDNHMAAAWCWMQECSSDEDYNFMHIDQHADLGVRGFAKDIAFMKTEPPIPLEEYCETTYSNSCGIYKSFQCDNYITACHYLFPNWFNANLFYYTAPCIKGSTQGSGYDNFSELRRDACFVIQDIKQFIGGQVCSSNELVIDEKMQKEKWIVNLDLDFFWDKNGNRLFDDQFIKDLGITIGNAMKNIQILTIALSPKWCGGWKNAIESSRSLLFNPLLTKSCSEYFEERKLFPDVWH